MNNILQAFICSSYEQKNRILNRTNTPKMYFNKLDSNKLIYFKYSLGQMINGAQINTFLY